MQVGPTSVGSQFGGTSLSPVFGTFGTTKGWPTCRWRSAADSVWVSGEGRRRTDSTQKMVCERTTAINSRTTVVVNAYLRGSLSENVETHRSVLGRRSIQSRADASM